LIVVIVEFIWLNGRVVDDLIGLEDCRNERFLDLVACDMEVLNFLFVDWLFVCRCELNLNEIIAIRYESRRYR
jgi:hypothetical protein